MSTPAWQRVVAHWTTKIYMTNELSNNEDQQETDPRNNFGKITFTKNNHHRYGDNWGYDQRANFDRQRYKAAAAKLSEILNCGSSHKFYYHKNADKTAFL